MHTAPRPRLFKAVRQFVLLGCLLLGAVTQSVFAQDLSGSVQLRLEMFVVTMVDGQEQYTASITARAGETVEYRILAVNHAEETLQAGTVVITVPIPGDTSFEQNSAVPVSEEVLVEFRALDSDYMTPPVFVVEEDERRIATAAEYSGIRWTLLTPMEPGEEREFSFRVTVD